MAQVNLTFRLKAWVRDDQIQPDVQEIVNNLYLAVSPHLAMDSLEIINGVEASIVMDVTVPSPIS